ncbi:aminotransferase class IV family protein [Cryptosporangium minutisporangium]|uniref:Aminotransferase class IV family protein n=1 Tax=Cryptosporangium minutisporangium TaxID=113569 RepID=A0ABP6T6Q6_9ACTN
MLQLNGRDVTAAEISGLALYNYGHFTSMRVENSRVPGLSLHLERLRADCAAVFGADLDLDAVRNQLREAASEAQGPVIVRVTVYDPNLDLAHPGADSHPHILISSRPAAAAAPPLRLKTVRYTRDLPEVKHVGLFATMHARRAAQRAGWDDVVFLDPDGRVTEGATWNIGFLDQNDRVVWPDAEVLPGVTMRLLDGLLQQAGTPSRSAPLTADLFGQMTGAFAANVSVGVRPISSIDDHRFDDAHPVLTALRKSYFAVPGEPI